LGGERLSLQNRPGGERPSCNRCAEPYHTTSLRRLPARRPKVASVPPSSRTTIRAPTRRPRAGRRASDRRSRAPIAVREPPFGSAAGRFDRGDRSGDPDDRFRGGVCMKLSKVGALAAIAVLAFSACGTTGGGGDKGTIQIWSELPRQGSSKGQTDTIVNAMKFAIDARGGKVDGWTIKYTDQDDSTAAAGKWTQERATALATEAATTADLVAYMGTFNSGAAKIVIPVLCKAGIGMISPANTYPGLTKPGKGEANEPGVYYPDGCQHNYYRVVPADDLQGDAGANWAKEMNLTKVYVLDDTEIYGK